MIICISHCEQKVDFQTQLPTVVSSLSPTHYGIIERVVDQTIYLKKKTDKNGVETFESWFYPAGGFSGTGGRFKPKPSFVPTSYENISKALLEAMDEQAAKKGAKVVEEMKTSVPILDEQSLYDFDALKEEFHNITSKLVEEDQANIAKITESVANVLGPKRTVKTLTKSQVELLNEVVCAVKKDFSLN